MGLNLSESMCPSCDDDDGMAFDDVVIRCPGEIHPKVGGGREEKGRNHVPYPFIHNMFKV